MIRKAYRDFFNLKDLAELTEREVLKHNINFVFGFPNDNAYPVLKKGLGYKDIGSLSIYIYPYRIGGIKHRLRCMNFLSMFFCRGLECTSYFMANRPAYTYLLDKDRTLYDAYRYKWFGGNYKRVALGEFCFVYRIIIYEGIRTAFLIDMNKVSHKALRTAVSYIRKTDANNFDLLMYVGRLPFNGLPLIKVPRRFEPKKFHFTGKFLDRANVDQSFLDIRNWNVNLSCYDLI
jgi:hypothetical protein